MAALASAADSLSCSGIHKVRIDDIDPPRIVAGSAERICDALAAYGVPIDGPIVYQSHAVDDYQQALHDLIEHDAVFTCTCSRKSLRENKLCVADCRKSRLKTNTSIAEQLQQLKGHAAVRLDASALSRLNGLTVRDEIQQQHRIEHVSTLGTPVLWRKDGYVSYLLATAIDDSGDITDVVRGADLWQETACQQLIMECLNRPVPRWVHVPCAVDQLNHKLGKQTRAASIHDAEPLTLLHKAWLFLGQSTQGCVNLEEFWANAEATWSLESIPKVLAKRID